MNRILLEKERLSVLQTHIIRQMGHTKRFAVIGGPGTGKTVLALEAFNNILKEEKSFKVAFIVFNRALKAFLMRYVNHTEANSVVFTWHSWLARYLMRTFNLDFNQFRQRYQIRDYTYDWSLIKADLLKEPTLFKYYTVFVDEAQDFPEPLLEILSMVSIRLYVFFDENQKFTPELLEQKVTFSMVEQTGLLHLLDLEEDYYDLTENFRNTKSIERIAKTYEQNYLINNITLRRSTVSKAGPLPVLRPVVDKKAFVADVIAEYARSPQISIGLLIAKVAGHKQLLDVYRDLFLADDRINVTNFYVHSRENEHTLNEHGLFLMTYQVAKGLEFDRVYLLELNHRDFRFDFYQKNAFYVSITRAKHQLTFVYDPALPDSDVMQIARRHANWFAPQEAEGTTV